MQQQFFFIYLFLASSFFGGGEGGERDRQREVGISTNRHTSSKVVQPKTCTQEGVWMSWLCITSSAMWQLEHFGLAL